MNLHSSELGSPAGEGVGEVRRTMLTCTKMQTAASRKDPASPGLALYTFSVNKYIRKLLWYYGIATEHMICNVVMNELPANATSSFSLARTCLGMDVDVVCVTLT